jgi:hypothetical protein
MSRLTTVSQSSAPARKKTVKLKVRTQLRALASVTSPDFPDISFAGWVGRIVEVSGKKAPFKYYVEWDEDVVAEMPKTYIDRCEEQQIYFRWACLTDTDFEVIE